MPFNFCIPAFDTTITDYSIIQIVLQPHPDALLLYILGPCPLVVPMPLPTLSKNLHLTHSSAHASSLIVVARHHLGPHTARPQHIKPTHLILTRPPILLLIVTIRQLHILIYRHSVSHTHFPIKEA